MIWLITSMFSAESEKPTSAAAGAAGQGIHPDMPAGVIRLAVQHVVVQRLTKHFVAGIGAVGDTNSGAVDEALGDRPPLCRCRAPSSRSPGQIVRRAVEHGAVDAVQSWPAAPPISSARRAVGERQAFHAGQQVRRCRQIGQRDAR
jgi:hypothetical protein